MKLYQGRAHRHLGVLHVLEEAGQADDDLMRRR